MRTARTVYLTAEFDADELLDELEDNELANELARRGTSNGSKAAALDAIAQIRRGDYSNAITTLEREFLPKWQSTEHCQRDFLRTTGIDPLARDVSREIEKAIA